MLLGGLRVGEVPVVSPRMAMASALVGSVRPAMPDPTARSIFVMLETGICSAYCAACRNMILEIVFAVIF